MKHRWYVNCFALALAIFLLVNLLIWKCSTEKLFSVSYGDGGDLARLGYLPAFKLQRKSENDLPLRHISLREYAGQPVDILTLGDSFTNGGGGGRNRYYQDYIASVNRLSVLNVGRYLGAGPTLDPLSTLVLLINSGEIDRLAPRAVIVSVSVKQAVSFLGAPLDPAMTAPRAKLQDPRNYLWYDGPPKPATRLNFITSGNFNYFYQSALRRYGQQAKLKIPTAPLSRALFSVQGNTLLFSKEEVDKISANSNESLARINDNLNLVAAMLAKKGIKLYFMPCVDKYDLYSPYIVDNKRPRNNFFELFRTLPKDYVFVDTKQILGAALEEGVQDLFFPDDTHWNWKASRRIFETVKFR
jgi:hypothetical protein